MAHQLRLSRIRTNHANGGYPYDGRIFYYDDHSFVRDVGLEPAADGRKTRERRMT